MLKVGDRVYAESRDRNNEILMRGYGVVKNIMYDSVHVLFDNMNTVDTVYTRTNSDYNFDVIRKLTKLEQALQ